MKKILLLLFLAVPLLAQSTVQNTFTAISAVGAGSIYTPSGVMLLHSVEWTITGAPASCTFQFEGTTKSSPVAADMKDLSGAITCTSNGLIHIADKPVSSVRPNVTALSGGATITVRYTGARY